MFYLLLKVIAINSVLFLTYGLYVKYFFSDSENALVLLALWYIVSIAMLSGLFIYSIVIFPL